MIHGFIVGFTNVGMWTFLGGVAALATAGILIFTVVAGLWALIWWVAGR